ncbi:MAG: M28 family peptidase [Acidobacteria bacterium]|nr:M28 family peptidase [Acidobacteriota bacterium]
MKRILSAAALAGAAFVLAADTTPRFSADRYLAHVKYLASPELKGRGTGTPEIETAAGYIAGLFKEFGLKPIADGSYYQGFKVTTNAHLGPNNHLVEKLKAGDRSLAPEKEFVPFNFSSSGSVTGGVVFAGYGISAPEYHYDDYAGVDAKGKFALIVLHEPQENDEKSVFMGKQFTTHAQVAIKAANAKAHGAIGVIIVKDAPTHPQEPEKFEKLQTSFGVENSGVYFVQIKAEEADRLLAAAGRNLKDSLAAIDKDLKPQSTPIPDAQVELAVDIQRDVATSHNLVGYLPGKTDEYVIIGAHYDHLGLGGPNSLAPDQYGTVHPGADDNASGTAGLLELARWFSSQPQRNRGVLFLSFAGEEMGLIGSNWYVNHPPAPQAKAVAMINLDMIGRIKNNEIHVSGVGTGATLQKTVDDVAARHDLKVVVADRGGYGPSDHMSFALKQIPVLFFFNGLHLDYHRPSDTWDKINAKDAARLLGLVSDIAVELASDAPRPQYVRLAEPPPSSGGGVGGGGGYGAYFGSIPDFTEIPKGVRFADVRDGSPAGKAGLKAGDILIEFDGRPIQNLMDFTTALRSRKPGDEVLVKVIRDSQTIDAKVLLTQRK